MKVRRLNRKRGKQKEKMAAVNKILKRKFLQPVIVISLLLLQMLAPIENYQYSRMRILHMIGVYYMSKEDKLTRKRKHIQITRILRKPRSYWHEKKQSRRLLA